MTDFDNIGAFIDQAHDCVFGANGTYNCRVCGRERPDF